VKKDEVVENEDWSIVHFYVPNVLIQKKASKVKNNLARKGDVTRIHSHKHTWYCLVVAL
jgi:hypothetical protein